MKIYVSCQITIREPTRIVYEWIKENLTLEENGEIYRQYTAGNKAVSMRKTSRFSSFRLYR